MRAHSIVILVLLSILMLQSVVSLPIPTTTTSSTVSQSLPEIPRHIRRTTEARLQDNFAAAASSPLKRSTRAMTKRRRIRPRTEDEERGPAANGDLMLLHAPCEFDLLKAGLVRIDSYPNHCMPLYNNRYTDEDWFRMYRSYDLEGFIFGQLYERLQRYELDSSQG